MDVGSFETVEVTLSGHVLTITLNRPQALNSFNRAMLDEFTRLWAFAATEDDVHVIVLRANGDRAFSTGADVKEATSSTRIPSAEPIPARICRPSSITAGNR